MEYGLGALILFIKFIKDLVLILVWVEYGLGGKELIYSILRSICLNPCLGGIWSWSYTFQTSTVNLDTVLILVWVEYGLGALPFGRKMRLLLVLILVWVEYGLGEQGAYFVVIHSFMVLCGLIFSKKCT